MDKGQDFGGGIPLPKEFDLKEDKSIYNTQRVDPAKKDISEKQPDSKDKKAPEKKSYINIILILLVIACVLLISLSVSFYTGRETEKTNRLKVESSLSDMKFAKQEVESRLQETEKVMMQYQKDLEAEKGRVRKMETNLDTLKAEKKELISRIDDNFQQIFSLKSTLDKETKNNKDIKSRMEKAEKEREALTAQLSQIRMAKEALENRIIDLSRKKAKGVELGTIVVAGQPGASGTQPAAPGGAAVTPATATAPINMSGGVGFGKLVGQVLVVNKEFAFVVINLGQKDGLKESLVFDVYRGQQFLGKVQVERIYDTMSSAVILPEFNKEEIKEGDMVKVS